MRTRRQFRTLAWMLVFCALCPAARALADDADVLPRGVSSAGITVNYYLSTTERYDPDGNLEDAAIDYNQNLDAGVFPGLSLLESYLGMPAGSATLGRSVVSFEYDFVDYLASFMHGLTDRLTVGVTVPLFYQKNTVRANLDASTATVGKNAALATLAPLPVPGTAALTADDVQDLLGAGLDIDGDGAVDIPGFGYERLATWSGSEIGDVELGGRYQYLKTPDWRLAFTGGVRLPTGRRDDPDDLADYAFGTGAYALLIRAHGDYLGVRNLVLNATARYDLLLPDHPTLRVPDSVDLPLTLNKEKVDRDLGDIVELEVSGTYTLMPGLSGSLLYAYRFYLKDRVSGDLGYAYSSLEDETDATSHACILGITYTTLPLFEEKRFAVPLSVSLSYRERFSGTNNVLDTDYLSLGIQVFF